MVVIEKAWGAGAKCDPDLINSDVFVIMSRPPKLSAQWEKTIHTAGV